MFPSVLSMNSLNGANGFTLNGIIAGEWSGNSVSTAGDINGDGVADVIIGASQANSYKGRSYVVFGSRNAFPATFNLGSLIGSNGFVLNGIIAGELSGNSVSTAGDINGDGIADVIIGAYSATVGANSYAGKSYVVFGSRNAFPATFNLGSLNGTNGFALNGVNVYDYTGYSVSTAGDINGDGIADVIIGASYAAVGANTQAGKSYVIFGSRNAFPATFNLGSLNGANGFALNGVNAYDYTGYSVSTAGDINGDGIADVIIGAYGANSNRGNSYVVFGSRNAFPAAFNLGSLNGSNGFALNGVNANDQSGNSVSAAGDINGDGIADVIIGAYGANSNRGNSYVVFGSRNAFPATFNLGSLNGSNGFALNGINSGDITGNSVSTAGDINGDGVADVIIGAPYANSLTGRSYVVFNEPTPTQSPSSTITPTPTQSPSSTITPTPTQSPSFTITPTPTPTQSSTPTLSLSSTQTPTPTLSLSSTQIPTESPSSSLSMSTFLQSSGVNSASDHSGGNNLGTIIGAVLGGTIGVGLMVGLGVYGMNKGWFGVSKNPLSSSAPATLALAINVINPMNAKGEQVINDQDNSLNYNENAEDVAFVGLCNDTLLSESN